MKIPGNANHGKLQYFDPFLLFLSKWLLGVNCRSSNWILWANFYLDIFLLGLAHIFWLGSILYKSVMNCILWTMKTNFVSPSMELKNYINSGFLGLKYISFNFCFLPCFRFYSLNENQIFSTMHNILIRCGVKMGMIWTARY